MLRASASISSILFDRSLYHSFFPLYSHGPYDGGLWLNASMDRVCMVLEYVRRIGQVGVHRSKALFVIYTDTCVGNMVKRSPSAQSHCARIPTFTNVLAIMRTTLARRTTRTTRSVRHRTVEVRYGLLHFVLVVVPLGSHSGISFFPFFLFLSFSFFFFSFF